MPTRLTIGLPFLNVRRTLTDTLRSVFAQTFRDWELLLVDDGSSDGSLELARGVRDDRVRVISDGQRLGLPARLNQIAALARGEYLARMDPDDLMHPARLERQVAFLDAHPEIDLVGTGAFTIDGCNRPRGIRGVGALNTTPSAVLRHGLFLHPTVTGRTDWFRKNPYDPSFARSQDFELWCRVCGTAR